MSINEKTPIYEQKLFEIYTVKQGYSETPWTTDFDLHKHNLQLVYNSHVKHGDKIDCTVSMN